MARGRGAFFHELIGSLSSARWTLKVGASLGPFLKRDEREYRIRVDAEAVPESDGLQPR